MENGHTTNQAFAHNRDFREEEILAEQVRQLYSLAPLGFMATLLSSLTVFFIVKEVISLRILFAWLASLFAITLLRGFLVVRFRKSGFQPVAARTWKNLFLAGLVLSGIAWGSIGIFPLSGDSLAHQMFIAIVLAGMAAGAAATFSAVKEGYPAYSIPALAPLTLRFFLADDRFHYALGGMLFLYGFILWRVSLNSYRINRMSLLLRFENRGMIKRLKSAKEHSDELNEKLLAEIGAKERAEAELRAHRDHLERVVEERTDDLVQINKRLQAEIEERKQTEQALRESEGRLHLAQRAGRVGVFDWDLISGKAVWTEQLEELFGLPAGDFEGNYEGWAKRVHPDDMPGTEAHLRQWMRERCNQVAFEYRFLRADGQTRWMAANARFSYLPDGTPARMIGTNVDITERKRLEEEIRHMAHHDALTGLPNRRLFMDIIAVEVADARRIRKRVAILFLDLDRFKEVNDTLGHEAGDALLKEVARRLRANIRESDTVARIGGDE
ncbi:MAG: diguanylate cyclase, partial [Alphaproteobacteria bacterium]|nr:diguanylate cyclase [Candidatus Nitrobium versatile]